MGHSTDSGGMLCIVHCFVGGKLPLFPRYLCMDPRLTFSAPLPYASVLISVRKRSSEKWRRIRYDNYDIWWYFFLVTRLREWQDGRRARGYRFIDKNFPFWVNVMVNQVVQDIGMLVLHAETSIYLDISNLLGYWVADKYQTLQKVPCQLRTICRQ